MAFKIERITEGCVLGEAPHWDQESQYLYFVDIYGMNILRYSPVTKRITKATVEPKHATFIIPLTNKQNHFIISLDNELVIVFWNGESENISVIESLATVDGRFNDAKCDSSGRLWAGTQVLGEEISKTEPLGSLYTFDSNRQLKRQIDKIRIANGLAFNDREKKMYYIDSLKGTIDRFDFDMTTGTLKNREILFTLKKFNISGIPDGMTIDTDGNLWVAVFGGGKILKVDGKKSETLLQTIDMPAIQVTSLVFGGINFDELYVTTGALEIDGLKLLSNPANGGTYKITNTGSKGFSSNSFILD